MAKRSLGPEAKKAYMKPLLTRNDLLVDITFASPTATATAVTALTIYDMCKAVDKGMVISQVKLVRKSGGRSGEYQAKRF